MTPDDEFVLRASTKVLRTFAERGYRQVLFVFYGVGKGFGVSAPLILHHIVREQPEAVEALVDVTRDYLTKLAAGPLDDFPGEIHDVRPPKETP